MYKLRDTQNDEVKGSYYAQQLRLAPNPTTLNYEVEKILATRKRNNKTEYLGTYFIFFSLIFFGIHVLKRGLNVQV
jgi:hypothetical protein